MGNPHASSKCWLGTVSASTGLGWPWDVALGSPCCVGCSELTAPVVVPLGSAAELVLRRGTHLPNGWSFKFLVMHFLWAGRWPRVRISTDSGAVAKAPEGRGLEGKGLEVETGAMYGHVTMATAWPSVYLSHADTHQESPTGRRWLSKALSQATPELS